MAESKVQEFSYRRSSPGGWRVQPGKGSTGGEGRDGTIRPVGDPFVERPSPLALRRGLGVPNLEVGPESWGREDGVDSWESRTRTLLVRVPSTGSPLWLSGTAVDDRVASGRGGRGRDTHVGPIRTHRPPGLTQEGLLCKV